MKGFAGASARSLLNWGHVCSPFRIFDCRNSPGVAAAGGSDYSPHRGRRAGAFRSGTGHEALPQKRQRRRLRCRSRKGRPREHDVPSERTFRRLLEKVDSEELKNVLTGWMQTEDTDPLRVVHADGKVVKNAQPPPARSPAQQLESAAAEPGEIPSELQKPKADKALTLVNFQTTDQRLVDQVAVLRDTNEEAAVASHLPKMDLAGVCLTADAAHTTKANCRQLTQGNGAEFLLFLKANQPTALAKAEQLPLGNFPPSGQHHGKRPRTH